MNNVIYGLLGYENDINFLIKLCQLLFSCQNKIDYIADKEPRYSSGYRAMSDTVQHEFWHYSESDSVIKWPVLLKNELPMLNLILDKVKLKMLDFIKSQIEHYGLESYLEENPSEYITRVRFVKYKASDDVRFNHHVDSGGATMFMFETSPGLRIKLPRNNWYSLEKNDYPLMIISKSTEDAYNIKAVEHEVIGGDDERYSCAIFLHGKKENITTLLRGVSL